MIINRQALKRLALEIGKERHHKFTRVSPDFLVYMDHVLSEKVREYVHRLPSIGKTIK